MKKALFIGGTGTISSAITAAVAAMPEWDISLINRANHSDRIPQGVRLIKADINDEKSVSNQLDGQEFDCVCDFIGFKPADVERDWRLFRGKTKQYMYISSASAYQKPVLNPFITESTPLYNPFWKYSQDKIACENYLMSRYVEDGFPVTIIRPSHTYDERKVPVGLHGKKGSWQVLKRMLDGKPVIVQGDGTSLWTLTHNSDFAKGFIGLMGNVHTIGNAYHITSDESLTWNQIYACIADALGVELKMCHVPSDYLAEAGREYDFRGSLFGDKANSVIFDNSKLKREVPGFFATVRFDEGIRMSLDFLLKHPEYQVDDPEFDAWCDRVINSYACFR